jgi:hypothetical protein
VVFFIPFFIWLIIVLIVDPYNFYSFSQKLINFRLKQNISYKINRPLFQVLKFEQKPTNCIVLGDSRANSIDVDFINLNSDKPFANLAYGGGSLQEVINTFWKVTNERHLDEVFIGLNFSLYNKHKNVDRVSDAFSVKNNFFRYAFSYCTIKSTYLILKSLITGIEVKIGVPSTTKERFWSYQLNTSAKLDYSSYEYPENYYEELKAISRFCDKKGIKLIFFIPPTHHDLQHKVLEYNLFKYEEKFKNDLKSLGDLYDFDYHSDLTEDKDNFNDPYHFTASIGRIIIYETFLNGPVYYSRYSKCEHKHKVSNFNSIHKL